jgi:hypothetical protein
MPITQSVRRAAMFSIVFAVGGASATEEVKADGRCRAVHGRAHTAFTTTNCTSPVGLCTEGKVFGAGPLDGATTFMAFGVAASAGMPALEPAANLSYSAQFNLTTRHGTLITKNLGVLDPSHFAFTEMGRVDSGTGRFENPSGVLFFSGSIVDGGNAFDAEITGQLCVDDDE